MYDHTSPLWLHIKNEFLLTYEKKDLIKDMVSKYKIRLEGRYYGYKFLTITYLPDKHIVTVYSYTELRTFHVEEDFDLYTFFRELCLNDVIRLNKYEMEMISSSVTYEDYIRNVYSK